MTAKQFREWEAYYELEPFGEERADIRSAQICQMLANVNRGKNQQPYKLGDFLLKFDDDRQQRPQTVQEKLNAMTVIMRAMAEAEAEGNLNRAAAQATAKAHGGSL